MPSFSDLSSGRLDTCHPDLQRLFKRVVETYDCSVLEGHRGEAAQNKAVDKGNSQLRWPKGKHNRKPSVAVDVAPYPVDWNSQNRFYHFAGYVKAMALEMGLLVRWGGDWDDDFDFEDQSFDDLPHWELLEAG